MIQRSRPRKVRARKRPRRRDKDDLSDVWRMLSQGENGPEPNDDEPLVDRPLEDVVFGRRIIRSLADD